MSEFKNVSTYADLLTLDEDEIVEGFRDGLRDAPEPGNNRSRSYWHGWRNGMGDAGRIPVDSDGMKLVADARKHGAFENMCKLKN